MSEATPVAESEFVSAEVVPVPGVLGLTLLGSTWDPVFLTGATRGVC